MIEEEVKSFIGENNLFFKSDKLLVGVSGGIDSVVLVDILVKLGYEIGIAHCNFKLRGIESDEDEVFVSDLADKYRIPLFIKSFDTKDYAFRNKLSIQMAARELRYGWFNKIKNKYGYNYVVIGHNLNDNIETFYINTTRGSGLKGLCGIPLKNDIIVRPLLCVSREQILMYAIKNNLMYREDSSNRSDKYMRNDIRHNVIPLLKKYNNNLEQVLSESMLIITKYYNFFDNYVKKIESSVVKYYNDKIILDLEKLINYDGYDIVCFNILNKYGFNVDSIKKILKLIMLKGESGQMFYSKDYLLLKNRNELIIISRDKIKVEEKETYRYKIDDVKNSFIFENKVLVFKEYKKHVDKEVAFKILENLDKNKIVVDKCKIEFPLILRKWDRGDYFVPFNMKGKKKLSDYFIDIKLSRLDKENVWLLCDGNNNIIWVIGYRLDDRYRVTETTESLLEIRLEFI